MTIFTFLWGIPRRLAQQLPQQLLLKLSRINLEVLQWHCNGIIYKEIRALFQLKGKDGVVSTLLYRLIGAKNEIATSRQGMNEFEGGGGGGRWIEVISFISIVDLQSIDKLPSSRSTSRVFIFLCVEGLKVQGNDIYVRLHKNLDVNFGTWMDGTQPALDSPWHNSGQLTGSTAISYYGQIPSFGGLYWTVWSTVKNASCGNHEPWHV